MIKLFIFILFCYGSGGARITRSPIGGIFNSLSRPSSLQAFKNITNTGTKAYSGRYLDLGYVLDSYTSALELCDFTSDNKGIVALLDLRPTNGICDTVCLLCNRLKISHLSIGWEPIEDSLEELFTFSYFPPPEILSQAYTALIKELNFDKITIFYEDEGAFIRLQDIINSWSNIQEPIKYRKLDPNGDNRETFKDILKVDHMSYHILDCEVENTIKYFQEITDIDNSTAYQSFILSNLDAYKLKLDNVLALKANVSTLHLTVLSEDKWQDVGIQAESAKLETALAADALSHLEKALRIMIDENLKGRKLRDPPSLCYSSVKAEQSWPLGDNLREALIATNYSGFTGNIQFDENGNRVNFLLYYSKLNIDSKFVYAGNWLSKTNIITTNNAANVQFPAYKSNAKLRVATRKGKPYIYEINEGNETRLIGYAVDLIDKIFNIINEENKINQYEPLQYEIYRVAGDEYGNPIEDSKKWNGIIGDLIERQADLGICDLTITSKRNAVVDFSIPFMSLGISLLMKEREPEKPNMFSFIQPLSSDVWLYLATTYILVSFLLLICARMSQDDWVNPHPCNQNPENLQNIWSLYNCMWLTMGAIMCQGCDILPRAAGSRWIAGMWWFFALIVTSSYTANMSTFLTENRRDTDIKSVQDLADQTKVTYGAVINGSTYQFFKDSNDTTYMKIWSTMSTARPSMFTKDNDEGVERVQKRKGKYAFFMESTAIEYFTKRNCDLKMVGGKLDSKEYGIALPKNSPYKGRVDSAILSLQESGQLEKLKQKWWEEEFNTEHCQDEQAENKDESLQMENTSGIFLVLGVGGILGLIVALIDFVLNAQQISVKEKVSLREAIISEWRASMNPKAMQKPAAPPRSAPPSTASPSPQRERSQSRAVSVLRAASSFINFDEIY